MATKNPVFWTTAEGVKMNVDDMDDNHVRNSFKQLLRRVNQFNVVTKNKLHYIEMNGDMDATEVDIY